MSTIDDILNRTDKENAEAYWNRIQYLEAENQRLKNALQTWIDVNEGAPNKYQWAEQALKGNSCA